eukprot:1161717-Pelagomonas_calceolata.AAC.9
MCPCLAPVHMFALCAVRRRNRSGGMLAQSAAPVLPEVCLSQDCALHTHAFSCPSPVFAGPGCSLGVASSVPGSPALATSLHALAHGPAIQNGKQDLREAAT